MISQVLNSVLSETVDKVTIDSSTAPAPTSDADLCVIGTRPVGGKGKKLCGLDDMDEDDQLIYYLKLAKWSERAIHEKFVTEGRIGYNQKTIGTRFARMRRFIMAENDKRLKDGTIVWLAADVSRLVGMFWRLLFQTNTISTEETSTRCGGICDPADRKGTQGPSPAQMGIGIRIHPEARTSCPVLWRCVSRRIRDYVDAGR